MQVDMLWRMPTIRAATTVTTFGAYNTSISRSDTHSVGNGDRNLKSSSSSSAAAAAASLTETTKSVTSAVASAAAAFEKSTDRAKTATNNSNKNGGGGVGGGGDGGGGGCGGGGGGHRERGVISTEIGVGQITCEVNGGKVCCKGFRRTLKPCKQTRTYILSFVLRHYRRC
jgi:hypothetical protein